MKKIKKISAVMLVIMAVAASCAKLEDGSGIIENGGKTEYGDFVYHSSHYTSWAIIDGIRYEANVSYPEGENKVIDSVNLPFFNRDFNWPERTEEIVAERTIGNVVTYRIKVTETYSTEQIVIPVSYYIERPYALHKGTEVEMPTLHCNDAHPELVIETSSFDGGTHYYIRATSRCFKHYKWSALTEARVDVAN